MFPAINSNLISFILLSLIIGLGVWFVIGRCREGLTSGEDTQQERSSSQDDSSTTSPDNNQGDNSTATTSSTSTSNDETSSDDTEPSKEDQNMADIDINQAVKRSDNIVPTSSGFLTDTGVLAGASQFNAMPTQVTDTKSSGGFNVCLKITPIGEEAGTPENNEDKVAKPEEVKPQHEKCAKGEYKNSLTGICSKCIGKWNSSMTECVQNDGPSLTLVGVIEASTCSSMDSNFSLASEEEVKDSWGVSSIGFDVSALCNDNKMLTWSNEENKWSSAPATAEACPEDNHYNGKVWVKTPITPATEFSAQNGLPPVPAGWAWQKDTIAIHGEKNDSSS